MDNSPLVQAINSYEDNGTLWLKLSDVARTLGFVQNKKDRISSTGEMYSAIRWERVRKYLSEISPELGSLVQASTNEQLSNTFVSENIYYRLLLKADTAVARIIQSQIADSILPKIRKNKVIAQQLGTDDLFSHIDILSFARGDST